MSICSWLCGSLVNRVRMLEGKVTQLEDQLSVLQNNNVMALDPYVKMDTMGSPKVIFTGINVQIVNGQGKTDSINGLGNLIVGYDADQSGADPVRCSVGTGMVMTVDGPGSGEAICTAVPDPGRPGGRGVFGNNQKTGSHNLIVGDAHMYTQYGGVVFGVSNTINMPWATVTGGAENCAAGEAASVSGGVFNIVGGKGITVQETHHWTSISGGRANWAQGQAGSISGGVENNTRNIGASISGGSGNKATGQWSHVSGGGGLRVSTDGNEAAGSYSSVLGGKGLTATQTHETIPPIP